MGVPPGRCRHPQGGVPPAPQPHHHLHPSGTFRHPRKGRRHLGHPTERGRDGCSPRGGPPAAPPTHQLLRDRVPQLRVGGPPRESPGRGPPGQRGLLWSSTAAVGEEPSRGTAMSLEPHSKLEIKSATRVNGGPATPRKGPPKFKQRQTRQFKSKPPKKGVQGFGDDIPGMEGLGTDITVICPWEAFSHLELHELAQYGII
ncbi:retinal rod rhodopsin-sensitive cGMP 3',5'-cyclic phosphodiesterase subunit gamma [Calypte anna]|uniref:retinal rod rhodopsin-sensitive cGMP 3',5'-cyclic phosphodiesterase subunit gamma n=1 Tax=Calypte anna TaxID=9244 RepID=UPI0011C3A708|nr:retinal rod rhodopsin-sensitive cGMP 3',5'-cyclic phosphodiesterase subunit gamma [Calypte anna]